MRRVVYVLCVQDTFEAEVNIITLLALVSGPNHRLYVAQLSAMSVDKKFTGGNRCGSALCHILRRRPS